LILNKIRCNKWIIIFRIVITLFNIFLSWIRLSEKNSRIYNYMRVNNCIFKIFYIRYFTFSIACFCNNLFVLFKIYWFEIAHTIYWALLFIEDSSTKIWHKLFICGMYVKCKSCFEYIDLFIDLYWSFYSWTFYMKKPNRKKNLLAVFNSGTSFPFRRR